MSSEFEAGMLERVVVVQALGVVGETGPTRRLGALQPRAIACSRLFIDH